MVQIYYVKIFFLIFSTVACVISSGIEEKIKQYFESEVFKAFQKYWRTHRLSFENAIVLALKENYGQIGMNVYIRRSADTLRIAKGFYGTDDVIELLLMDTTLTTLPHLVIPDVTFALASNALRLEAGLSKMIMVGRYALFRNQSDVENLAQDEELNKSPFSYSQVQHDGQLAITAEQCTIVGYVLAKLNSLSIDLGHDTFRVRNCKFNVEISSFHPGEPPIIAPYFTTPQSKQLELLLTRPIRSELLPKLQAAVFSYINASLVFRNALQKFRQYQDNLFKETLKHVEEIVRGINNKTIETNQVTMALVPATVAWKSHCRDEACSGRISVHNVTLYGLDTLYSSHTGGPYKLQSPRITDSLRFHTLMVRGRLNFENSIVTGNHDFVAEIHDVSVDFELDVEKTEPSFEVVNWRSFEFSIIELEHQYIARERYTAYVHGYLLNKLPTLLKDHLVNMYEEMHKIPENKLTDTDNTCVTVAATTNKDNV